MRSSTTLFLAAAALAARATTYHVSVNGDDAHSGLTLVQAFRTLQHGADVAVAGDSVVAHAGSYTGFAAMDHTGTVNAPIVFSAQGNVTIDVPCTYNDLDGINVENVAYVVVEGFTVNGMPRAGIRSALSGHVVIRGNTCTANGHWGIFTGFAEDLLVEHNTCSGSVIEHGIYVSNSADRPIVRYNHLFDNHANGLHMNGDVSEGGDGVISEAQVYGNVVHGNGVGGGSGINCDGVVNSVIHDNLLYDNHASGISLYVIDGGAPSTGDRVYNNTIINAADARWCVNITAGCSGNQVLNNILINLHPWRGSITIAADAWSGFVSDFNLVMDRLSPDDDNVETLAQWQAGGQDQHSHIAQAMSTLFVDATNGDFHALDANAQEVDAGTSAVSLVTTADLDGVLRPQGAAYDIGCYEHSGSVGIDAVRAPAASAYCADGYLHVPDARAGDRLVLFDASGRAVGMQRVERAPCVLPLPPGGIVLIAIITPEGTRRTARTVVIR